MQRVVKLKSQNGAPSSSVNGIKVATVTSRSNSLPDETDAGEPSPVEKIPPAKELSVPTYANVSHVTMETMSEQLHAVHTALSLIVEQIREVQNRQSALEQEVRAMKKPQHVDESVPLVSGDMSPADVSFELCSDYAINIIGASPSKRSGWRFLGTNVYGGGVVRTIFGYIMHKFYR